MNAILRAQFYVLRMKFNGSPKLCNGTDAIIQSNSSEEVINNDSNVSYRTYERIGQL